MLSYVWQIFWQGIKKKSLWRQKKKIILIQTSCLKHGPINLYFWCSVMAKLYKCPYMLANKFVQETEFGRVMHSLLFFNDLVQNFDQPRVLMVKVVHDSSCAELWHRLVQVLLARQSYLFQHHPEIRLSMKKRNIFKRYFCVLFTPKNVFIVIETWLHGPCKCWLHHSFPVTRKFM